MIRSRYRRIVYFFARLLLSLIIWDLFLPRVGLRKASQRTRPERMRRSAAAYRRLAIQMGGVLIKVGQFLSSRVDVLPPEFTDELVGLQDEVPPTPFKHIQRVVESEFGRPLAEVFSEFEEKPLAAASLGQVHCASLEPLGGESKEAEETSRSKRQGLCKDVVVKVLRPNIEQIIETDLAALRTVGNWLHRYRPIRKRADVPALLLEFTRILYEEVDYLSEGRNAETFAENFKDYPGVRVPRVYWTHTTRRVLTLENVWAIKITDYQAISEAGISRAEVASRLLDTYLKQIFEDGFFHADPHPGNLFVHPLEPKSHRIGTETVEWELTFIDFGMTGRVPSNLRDGLRELLIGVGTQDSRRVVEAYKMMDLLLPNADLALLERAEARVFEQFWGKNMTELTSVSYQEMKVLADEFRELLYDMPFQVPQNIIFLARCVGILSGMCTGLDPQFNLWQHLAPFARKIMAEEAIKNHETWLAEAGKLARTVLALPYRLDSSLSKLERGEITFRSPEVVRQGQMLERVLRNMVLVILFGIFFLGGIQLYLGGSESLAIASIAAALILLIVLWWKSQFQN